MIFAIEPLVVLAIAPLLLFPTLRPTWTALALVVLLVVWLLRAFMRRELWPVTAANLALLVFCLTIPLAVWASAAPELTLPKLMGLILGLAVFRVIAWSGGATRSLVLALAAFFLFGLAIWTLGLLGSGFSFLQPVAQQLPPALIQVIGGADQVVNPNILAGALVPYLPVALAIAAYAWQSRRRFLSGAFLLEALLIVATLLRTQSRSAVVGAAIGLGVLVLLLAWFRVGVRGKFVLSAGLLLLLVVGAFAGAVLLRDGLDFLADDALAAEQGSVLNKELSLASRIEIWSRALYMLQDFPFTGIGLGTFSRVLQLLYPLFLVGPDTLIGHAHNMFLQMGIDLGLGGMIGYIGILLTSTVAAWQVARSQRRLPHFLALGLLTALVSLHVYGMTDALEAKPGVVLWVLLGLIAALSQQRGSERT